MQRAAHLLGEARVGRARERHAHPRVQAVCMLLQSDEAARVQRDGVAPAAHAAHALAAPVQIAEYLCVRSHGGAGFGQLALRRLHAAPEQGPGLAPGANEAPGQPRRRPAPGSANTPLGRITGVMLSAGCTRRDVDMALRTTSLGSGTSLIWNISLSQRQASRSKTHSSGRAAPLIAARCERGRVASERHASERATPNAIRIAGIAPSWHEGRNAATNATLYMEPSI